MSLHAAAQAVIPRSAVPRILDADTLIGAAREIARGDTSTARVLALAGLHPWMGGMVPVAAQDEVFEGGRDGLQKRIRPSKAEFPLRTLAGFGSDDRRVS